MDLQGNQTLLRAPRPTDLEDLVGIFAEPEVARWWRDHDRTRIEAELLGDDPDVVVFVVDVAGAVAGIIQFGEETDPEYRAASIDIAISTRWHGAGVALDAIRTLARHLFDERGHHHLTIDPAAHNQRAIAAYAKVGFRPVGILRQNERGEGGRFHDTVLMDLLADDLT
ncbi:MAG: GNAT family N-acetyltransferase [Acidimicrobiia bacterium]|nr:GNAT family N-acetyltransferase [Acidimicrobiia bacterium]